MNPFTIQKSFAISAGAGSGKTYTLSRRYINAILGFDYFNTTQQYDKNEEKIVAKSYPDFYDDKEKHRADIDEIVTLTFTNAAALEMKNRIFELIKEELARLKNDNEMEEEKKEYIISHLEKALRSIDKAKITTIHGFAFELLKNNADILKLDTDLEPIDDLERNKIFEQCYYEVLQERVEDILEFDEDITLHKLKDLASRYLYNKKFRAYIDHFANDIDLWKKLLQELYSLEQELVEQADEEIPGVKGWYEKLTSFEEVVEFGEFVEAKIGEKLNFRTKAHKEKYANVRILRDNLNADKFVIDEEMEERFSVHFKKLRTLLQTLHRKYRQTLQSKSLIDFDMMVELLWKLLEQRDFSYKYVMVDEFQDTNSTQYEIVKRLHPQNLFIVGDEKQSIYAFQGGEIEVFKQAIEDLDNEVVPLDINYRSDKKILEFVNNSFEHLFDEEIEAIEPNFCATYQMLHPKNNEEKGSVETLLAPNAKTLNVELSDREIEAKNIALYIKEIFDGKRHQEIKENYIDKQKLAIGVVYDSKTYMHLLKNELNALGIDCKINGGENFWDTDEIKDIFSYLKVIVDMKTQRDIDGFYASRVLQALGYSQKEIFELLQEQEKLKDLLWIEHEALHDLIERIYLKLYANYDNPLGAKANVELLIAEVITLQKRNDYNDYMVISILEENFHFGDMPTAMYDSPSANSIELSSIHYTKGLAYPMIILADADKNIGRLADYILNFEKFLYEGVEHFAIGFKIGDYSPLARKVATFVELTKQLSEKKRLLYVALTRAKHALVLSYKENDNANSYITWLQKQLEKIEPITLVSKELLESETLEEKPKEMPLDIAEESVAVKEVSSERFNHKSIVGEAVHKIIELHWSDMDEKKIAKVIENYGVDDHKEEIFKMVEAFKSSTVYKELQQAEEIHFELPYVAEENGRIDLVYKLGDRYKIVDFKTGKKADYSKQLQKYEAIIRRNTGSEVTSEVLYLGGEA